MISIKYETSTLMAIPAVHYRVVFTEYVNLACANKNTRPDAIAVELGPKAVSEIANWLKEMGVVRTLNRMPCMLGLIRTNRRVHPDFKDAAIRLQKETGCQLHELQPDVLRKTLAYTPISLICLSPSDSIIEAIRCALELDIPLYGIDLEEFAHFDRKEVFIQDPIYAQSNLADYVEQNNIFCEACRDKVVDERREIMMTSRLKGLLKRHKRVLFTGGLAHWQEIQRRLNDPGLRPSEDLSAAVDIQYMRVLVHPLLATHQMDIFPSVTSWYEDHRRSALRDNDDIRKVNFYEFIEKHLKATYRKCFTLDGKEQMKVGKLHDFHGIDEFERYLKNLCIIRQRLVPDMSTALQASEAMMSQTFTEILAENLMDYDLGWAKPSDWPDLSIIGPAPLTLSEESWLRTGQKAELLIPPPPEYQNENGEATYLRTSPFYISSVPHIEGRSVHVPNPWVWPNEPQIEREKPPLGHARVWPPCDNRLFALSFQAAEVANNSFHDPQVYLFEGSLYDGVDIKSTLRSSAKGENHIFVKDNHFKHSSVTLDETKPEPTVFIFTSPNDNSPVIWQCLYAGYQEDLEKYINKLSEFEEIVEKHGPAFVSSVNYFEHHTPENHLSEFVHELRLLKGSIVFGNPCLTNVQAARWLENGDFKCCPSYSINYDQELIQLYHEVKSCLPEGTDIREDLIHMINMYRKRHGISIDLCEWTTALIQFAIPYAKQRVVIVAPDHFELSTVAACDARRFNIQLDILPLSYFPANDILKARQQYIVESDEKGHEYPTELERLLGEPVDSHFLNLPLIVREQLIEE